MICIILRCTVALAVVIQFGCQMSKATNTANWQRVANETKAVSAEPIKLIPVDEAPQDRSYAAFRDQLLTAARDHDAAFVLSVLDPNIINGADTERGVKKFKKQWQIDESEGELWETLTTVLTMGGSFRVTEGTKEFCAPYVTSNWPTVVEQLPQGADPLDYQVITDKDVAMRAEPNLTAVTVANLTYDVVKVNSSSSRIGNPHWRRITTLTGQEGYVPAKYIRGASDYHACFKKIRGKWLMTELAALE